MLTNIIPIARLICYENNKIKLEFITKTRNKAVMIFLSENKEITAGYYNKPNVKVIANTCVHVHTSDYLI